MPRSRSRTRRRTTRKRVTRKRTTRKRTTRKATKRKKKATGRFSYKSLTRRPANRAMDARRKARKQRGKRVSKSGRVYYEYRRNRYDKKGSKV